VTDLVARRRRFAKWWLIAVGIGLASLVVILLGVYLFADDTTRPCGCSPIPSPTASTTAS
jgi:hypothetical protein